jgi:hypothetical protein
MSGARRPWPGISFELAERGQEVEREKALRYPERTKPTALTEAQVAHLERPFCGVPRDPGHDPTRRRIVDPSADPTDAGCHRSSASHWRGSRLAWLITASVRGQLENSADLDPVSATCARPPRFDLKTVASKLRISPLIVS